MYRREPCMAAGSYLPLQEAIDSAEIIGRWEWDIAADRLHADATVALLFNVDPIRAAAGVPLDLFLDGIHLDDRAKTADVIARSAATGNSYVQEYRVHSADGATRWVLARGLIELDETGRPWRGTGFLVDITQNRAEKMAYAVGTSGSADYFLEQAAEHCLAVRLAVRQLPEPLLHNMTDMLLLEIGQRIAVAQHRN